MRDECRTTENEKKTIDDHYQSTNGVKVHILEPLSPASSVVFFFFLFLFWVSSSEMIHKYRTNYTYPAWEGV